MEKEELRLSVGNNQWAVGIPKGSRHLKIDHIDCWGSLPEQADPGNDCEGFVSTRGKVRVRATVRYGWSNGYEQFQTELFVHPESKAFLPWNDSYTRGWIDVFTISNEDLLVHKLFGPALIGAVNRQEKQYIEVDADLLLDQISFGSECGIRYSAKVLSAAPWKEAKALAKAGGFSGHC